MNRLGLLFVAALGVLESPACEGTERPPPAPTGSVGATTSGPSPAAAPAEPDPTASPAAPSVANTAPSVVSAAPSAPPTAGKIDLTHWNLTLPTGREGKPDVVPTGQLLGGYKSEYFFFNDRGALVFWCPVTGVTTKGTHYPRSELRETDPSGSLVNWHLVDGPATLTADLAITQVPGTGRLTVGQIHDDGTDGIKSEPLLKLVYKFSKGAQTGKLVAQVRPTPEAKKSDEHVLVEDLPQGTKFSYRIHLDPSRQLRVDINGGERYHGEVDPAWERQGLYFKIGSYLEDNAGDETEGGRVEVYSLAISH